MNAAAQRRLHGDVAALLAAVATALDIPLPGLTRDDQMKHDALLRQRADTVRILVNAALNGHGVADVTADLRQHVAENPVDYAPYVPAEERDGGDGS